jgi:hypothetical protein
MLTAGMLPFICGEEQREVSQPFLVARSRGASESASFCSRSGPEHFKKALPSG